MKQKNFLVYQNSLLKLLGTLIFCMEICIPLATLLVEALRYTTLLIPFVKQLRKKEECMTQLERAKQRRMNSDTDAISLRNRVEFIKGKIVLVNKVI